MSSDVFGAIERAGLESLLKRRHYGDGTVLMSEGEPADGCCFVESGDLRVELTASAERDRALVLGHVGPGGVVGEMGLVEGGVRTATVVTEGEVTV